MAIHRTLAHIHIPTACEVVNTFQAICTQNPVNDNFLQQKMSIKPCHCHDAVVCYKIGFTRLGLLCLIQLWWWHTVKKLVQVNLYKKLDRLTWFLVQDFSCTSFLHQIQHSSIPYKKLACTWLEWWALIGWLPITAMFSLCCVDVVDNLLYKVNIVCLLIYFLNLFKLFK